jgi:3-oxoacyl-(acyl-carrier-protein) synthase
VVFNQTREKAVDTVLCNAFAFGGNNASLIVARVR